MTKEFSPLPYSRLQAGVSYRRPPQRLPERVREDSPATDAMTDLTEVTAITTGPCATLVDAEKQMIANGVRMLLVADQENQVLGLITTTDLTGEKPMKYLKEVGGKREEIFVRDIMTPREALDVLAMTDVARAKVGDIVETLKHAGRQHALAVDIAPDGRQSVRGIFSANQIGQQLGVIVEPPEVAQTFAELGNTLR